MRHDAGTVKMPKQFPLDGTPVSTTMAPVMPKMLRNPRLEDAQEKGPGRENVPEQRRNRQEHGACHEQGLSQGLGAAGRLINTETLNDPMSRPMTEGPKPVRKYLEAG